MIADAFKVENLVIKTQKLVFKKSVCPLPIWCRFVVSRET